MSNKFYIQQYRACCLYRLKNATSGSRDAEHFDDVLYSYTSINLTLGIILGVVLLITTDIPHYGKLTLINIFEFYFICKLYIFVLSRFLDLKNFFYIFLILQYKYYKIEQLPSLFYKYTICQNYLRIIKIFIILKMCCYMYICKIT